MGLEKLCAKMRRIPISSWKRDPAPAYQDERNLSEKGSGSITYLTKHKELGISIKQSYTWTTSRKEASDWNDSDSWKEYKYNYFLSISKGPVTKILTRSGEDNEIHTFFEDYLENKVYDFIRQKNSHKEYVNSIKEEKNRLKNKMKEEKAILAFVK